MLGTHPPLGTGFTQRARPLERGGTLLGIFVGLVLGLSIALAVAYYLNKAGNPYQTTPPKDPIKDSGRAGRVDGANPIGPTTDKPRFDFYKILPGVDEPKSGIAPKVDGKNPGGRDAAGGLNKPVPMLHLQAGAFSNEGEAENLKARLALSGLEAEILVANVQDKGVVYRVRLGPYDNVDEMNKIRNELTKRGFEAAVIKS